MAASLVSSAAAAMATQVLCDALILRIEPQHHWLGVYQGEPQDPTSLQRLDRVVGPQGLDRLDTEHGGQRRNAGAGGDVGGWASRVTV